MTYRVRTNGLCLAPVAAPPLNQPHEKRTRFNDSGAPSSKPTQAPPGRHILAPANAELSAETIKSLNPAPLGHIYLHGKNGTSHQCKLCVNYLLGKHCDSKLRCGFHLHTASPTTSPRLKSISRQLNCTIQK